MLRLCSTYWFRFVGASILLLLAASCCLLGQESGRVFTIAIVRDGPSWYFDAATERFLKELEPLARDNYTFKVKDEFDAGHDPEKVGAYLRAALADAEVDIVYASGTIATERAALLSDAERTKPVMAGALQFSDIRGHPISGEGTSTLENFTFITEPKRVAADLALLTELTGAEVLDVVMDEVILPELHQLDEARETQGTALGLKIRVHPIPVSPREAVARIPADVQALYVPILPRMDREARAEFFRLVTERKIPTVAMLGMEEVELGALASLAPDDDDAVARRTALNIHQLLLGVPTASLPVYLPVQDHLVINAVTAQAIGWSPTYETSLEAEFINEETARVGAPITLFEAMTRAARENAGVMVAREEANIREEEARVTRGGFFPQASAEASHVRTGFSDKIDPNAPDYVHQGAFGVRLRQVLFNDELNASVRAQRRSAQAAVWDARSRELDAMEAASDAYFDYLRASALYGIEKENLRLTQNNLQLARLRVEIGSAEPSEVFRWEQDRARGKATLIQRDSDRDNALVQFNRVLGVSRETRWTFQDMDIGDKEFFFLDDELRPSLETRAQFEKFVSFMRWQAVENSPELASFDYSLGAQGQILRQKQRRYYVPELAATAGLDRTLSGSDLADTEGENQYSVGLQFSFPLFEGGRRRSDILRQKAVIRQLAAQRLMALQQIEQRTMTALNNMAGAHPNIRLSRAALEAAERNFRSAREKYSQGAASILDLLDAQTGLLQQKRSLASAIYTYFKELHRMQRSVAWFEFQQDPEEKNRYASLLKEFLEGTKGPDHPVRNRRQAEAVRAIRAAEADPALIGNTSVERPVDGGGKKQ